MVIECLVGLNSTQVNWSVKYPVEKERDSSKDKFICFQKLTFIVGSHIHQIYICYYLEYLDY